jgi:hypothetical protein
VLSNYKLLLGVTVDKAVKVTMWRQVAYKSSTRNKYLYCQQGAIRQELAAFALPGLRLEIHGECCETVGIGTFETK